MGPVLLVTGGSRGIGAATAVLAGGRGYSVAVNYVRNESAAHSVVDRIRAAGGSAHAVKGDVSIEADVVGLFDNVEKNLGPVQALVNNAGILDMQCRIAGVSEARLRKIFATNVIGTILCAREAVRRMSTASGGMGGAIVNVSSAASRSGSPGEYVDYAASKGAIDTFTIGLAKEVASEGIRVNAVRPAFIYTDIHASAGEPGRVDRVKKAVPMRRGGHPDEIARAILWLLSDEASYATGTFIDLAGGA